MKPLSTVAMYSRFVFGLPRFLRRRITLDEARRILVERIAARERNFLALMKKGVYETPRSPYLFLLKQAGCTQEDLHELVQTIGIEGTLGKLYDAGVHVSFEQFKGREPITRGGGTFATDDTSFDNPHLRAHYEKQTSGSSGSATRVMLDLDHIDAIVPYHLIAHEAHGVRGAPTVLWAPELPSGNGVNNIMRSVLMENVVRRWFSPLRATDLKPPLRFRAATWYVGAAARIAGQRVPSPEPLPFGDAHVLARYAASLARSEGRCLVRTSVSRALRVALAAREEGIDLTGVTFMGGGEPVSRAKTNGINASGARHVSNYAFTEAGPVGLGCANPVDGTDVHFFHDLLGLIQRPQTVPGSDTTVNAFCFTSLLPSAPKIMLNVESDDSGIIEERSCGCLFESIGFTSHIRQIFSARKLTGEGITLVGSDFERIMSEVLPTRFGGSEQDYQLVEEEDASGLTQLSLLVSPELDVGDERVVADTLLTALGRVSPGADSARAFISGARLLSVRREKPHVSTTGKVPPFRVRRQA